jgi:hypothetical protein
MLTSNTAQFSFRVSCFPATYGLDWQGGPLRRVVRALQNELNVRELVKLRFIASKEVGAAFQNSLLRKQVQNCPGDRNVAIFYKMAEDAEKRTITCPDLTSLYICCKLKCTTWLPVSCALTPYRILYNSIIIHEVYAVRRFVHFLCALLCSLVIILSVPVIKILTAEKYLSMVAETYAVSRITAQILW